MNINDYLISQTGISWSVLLKDWIPPLPQEFRLWLVNRLGDVFVLAASERVMHLDLGSGSCVEVARDRQHFAALLDSRPNAEQWLRISLVNECRRMGMQLGPFECYGFKIPPTLGGAYEASNLTPTKLSAHYSYQAYICKQQDVYWVAPP
jgi:hypothetical protein